MDLTKMKEALDAMKPEHEPEALMKEAEKAIERILPKEIREIFYKPREGEDTVDSGAALCGGVVLFGKANEDAMGDLIKCALELTCQAIVAEKWNEASE